MYKKISKNIIYSFLSKDGKFKKGNKLFDIACHNGKNFNFFKNVEYFGGDISLDNLKALKKNYEKSKAILIDLNNFIIPDNIFDIIVCTHTIEWVKKENRYVAVEKLIKCLKNEGMFIINFPNQIEYDELKKLFLLSFNNCEIKKYRSTFTKYFEEKAINNKFLNYLFLIFEKFCGKFFNNHMIYMKCSGKINKINTLDQNIEKFLIENKKDFYSFQLK